MRECRCCRYAVLLQKAAAILGQPFDDTLANEVFEERRELLWIRVEQIRQAIVQLLLQSLAKRCLDDGFVN